VIKPPSRSTIKELEVLGVKRPATTPIFYRVAASRLTTDDSIEVMGAASSGEVEFVCCSTGAVGGHRMDHTDREVEPYGVPSRSRCARSRSPQFWAFDDVAAIGTLILRSHATITRCSRALSEGSVARCAIPRLIARICEALADGADVLRHTAVHGGVSRASVSNSR
jgi:hypothetical protein